MDVSCGSLKVMHLLFYIFYNITKKSASCLHILEHSVSCYASRLEIQWNLPVKLSFKIYFSCCTSEGSSSSTIDLKKSLMAIPAIFQLWKQGKRSGDSYPVLIESETSLMCQNLEKYKNCCPKISYYFLLLFIRVSEMTLSISNKLRDNLNVFYSVLSVNVCCMSTWISTCIYFIYLEL